MGCLNKKNGQNLVELVVVLPLVILLILGIIQFAMYWRTFQTVESIALDGANIAASTVDDISTSGKNEAIDAAIIAMNGRLSSAGFSTVATPSVTSGTPPNALYQTAASNAPGFSQVSIDYRSPTSNGIVVQLVYNFVPILAGTSIPVPGGAPIKIIPDFVKVTSSQIQQYNTY